MRRHPFVQPPYGWGLVPSIARALGLRTGVVRGWVAKNLVPHRKIGGYRYVPFEAVKELVSPWPCQLCREECYGPKGLADHLNSIHMMDGVIRAVDMIPQLYELNIPWPCPEATCPFRRRPFKGCPALVRHLEEHSQDRESRGIRERRREVAGGIIGRKPYRCRHPGCEIVTPAVKGAARGLCARHYKQGQLEGRFKREA